MYEPKDKHNYDNVLAIAKKNGIEFFWLGIIKGSKKGELIYQSDRSPIVLNLAPTSYTMLHNYGCIKGNTNFKNRWYYNQCDGWKLSYVCEKNDNGKFEIWGLNICSTLLFKLEFLTLDSWYIIIAISVSVFILIILGIVVFLCSRKYYERYQHIEISKFQIFVY